MFKSSDTGPASLRRRTSGRAGLSWILAALIPIAALAGVATLDGPDAGKPTATPKQHAANGAYQIRCWQEGRLLFEENRITLPSDNAQYGFKMAGTDRKGKPIFVAETRNATCLIRSAVDEPTWPR